MRPTLRVSFAIAAICAAGLPGALRGQSFGACGSNICASTGANVGIGTASATYPLTVNGGAYVSSWISTSGYLYASSYIQTPHINAPSGLLLDTSDNGYDITFGASYMTVQHATGYVGIGTTSPAHLLHVAGTIGAEEVIVSSTGADYVFGPDYHLRPLQDVAQYIKENHHLPDIPSAAEVKEKGLSVGEMEAKLLAKVEELTLHLIQAEARSDRLEQQNRELQEKFAQFEKVLRGDSVKANRESLAKPLQ